MCDLSRESLQSLSLLECAKAIHRIKDATPLEIQFADYIVDIESDLRFEKDRLEAVLRQSAYLQENLQDIQRRLANI